MKKILIRIAVLIVVFIGGLFGFGHLMNIENTDNTADVPGPSLPVVYAYQDGELANAMYGYTGKMKGNYTRDTLTLIPSDYNLQIAVDPYGTEVSKVSFEVRSGDDTSLIQNGDVDYLTLQGNLYTASIPVEKLLDEGTEYLLRIIVTDQSGTEVSYYTRIVCRDDYDVSDELAFCRSFSAATIDESALEKLSSYLEPNSSGDNSSFAHVDIHSSYRMVTYNGLNVSRVTEPVPDLMEARSSSVSYRFRYIIQTTEEADTTDASSTSALTASVTSGTGTEETASQVIVHYYQVEENFRVRSGDNRMYLLDYERTMNQLFMNDGSEFGSNTIDLGILDEEPVGLTSQDGAITAFAQSGVLWSYNNTSGQITRIYGNTDNYSDVRDLHDAYEIRITDIDESGSLDFLVFGYMNQGIHEGEVGILSCRYDALLNDIEEEVFISYDKSFPQMKSELGSLAYINNNRELYCMLDESVYKISLSDRTVTTLVDNLPQECYDVCSGGDIFAWMKDKDPEGSSAIQMMNLETGETYEFTAGEGELIKLIGFLGRDMVYGVADRDMLRRDSTGNTVFPMKQIFIIDEQGNELTEYRKDGLFVVDTEIEDTMIRLERAYYSEETDRFTAADEDQILSNVAVAAEDTEIESYNSGMYKLKYRLKFSSNLTTKEPVVRIPKMVVFEDSRTITLPETDGVDSRFYVYGRGGLDMATEKAGDAIERANEIQGVVVNSGLEYIWEKGNRASKVEITGITPRAATESETSVCVSVEQMLAFAGVYEDVDPYLQSGMTALDILEKYIPGQVIDLSGCSMDAALYFVNQGIPVFAMKDNTTAVLILGYDEFGNTILLDSVAGNTYKCGPADSEAMFDAAGDIFYSYIPAR